MSQTYRLLKTFDNVGKRFKSSKTKTTWKFAFISDLVIHELDLYVSKYSGKIRVVIDDILIDGKNTMIGNVVNTTLNNHSILVQIDDTIKETGCALFIDGYDFDSLEHRTERDIICERNVKENQKKMDDVSSVDFSIPQKLVSIKLQIPNLPNNSNSRRRLDSDVVFSNKSQLEKELSNIFK